MKSSNVLGLEACKSSKMLCPQLEDSTIFWFVENVPRSWPFLLFCLGVRQKPHRNFMEAFFFLRMPEYLWKFAIIFVQTTFLHWKQLHVVSLVLVSWGSVLGKSVLGLGLFCVFFSLASSLVFSTPPLLFCFGIMIEHPIMKHLVKQSEHKKIKQLSEKFWNCVP